MGRCGQCVVCVATLFYSFDANAQHHHRYCGGSSYATPFVASPGYGFSGYNGRSYFVTSTNIYGPPPALFVPAYSPPPLQTSTTITPVVFAPSKSLTTPSSPAAKLKSLDHQARGDQKMRDQKWADARVSYTSAVSAAPDRAESHLRLGICYMALSQFDSAIRQFKLAAFLDPTIGRSGLKLESVFGPGSQLARNSIISKLRDWVGDDIRSSDRLFLMGVVLQLNGDHRGREFLEAAVRTSPSGKTDHITAFLNRTFEPAKDLSHPILDDVPPLKDQPALPVTSPSSFDVRFPKGPSPAPAAAPVPMPDGP